MKASLAMASAMALHWPGFANIWTSDVCPSWGQLAIHPSSFFFIFFFFFFSSSSFFFFLLSAECGTRLAAPQLQSAIPRFQLGHQGFIWDIIIHARDCKSLRTELASPVNDMIKKSTFSSSVHPFPGSSNFELHKMGLNAALTIKLGRLDIHLVTVGISFSGPCVVWISTNSSCVTLPRHILVSGNNLQIISAIIKASWVVLSFHFLTAALVTREYLPSVRGWSPCTRKLQVIHIFFRWHEQYRWSPSVLWDRSVNSSSLYHIPHHLCRIYRRFHAVLSGDSSCRRKIVLGLR